MINFIPYDFNVPIMSLYIWIKASLVNLLSTFFCLLQPFLFATQISANGSVMWWEQHCSWSGSAGISVPTLLFNSCMFWGKVFYPFEVITKWCYMCQCQRSFPILSRCSLLFKSINKLWWFSFIYWLPSYCVN